MLRYFPYSYSLLLHYDVTNTRNWLLAFPAVSDEPTCTKRGFLFKLDNFKMFAAINTLMVLYTVKNYMSVSLTAVVTPALSANQNVTVGTFCNSYARVSLCTGRLYLHSSPSKPFKPSHFHNVIEKFSHFWNPTDLADLNYRSQYQQVVGTSVYGAKQTLFLLRAVWSNWALWNRTFRALNVW